MTQERDFKGIWIPRHIWLHKDLTHLDKIVLMEIDSLSKSEKGCFASNKYLSEFCQCSESAVSKSVSKLIKLGFLVCTNFDGRKRELRSNIDSLVNYDNLAENDSLPSKIYESACQNLLHINIDNNIVNKKTKGTSEKLEEKLPEIIKNLNLDEEYVELTKSWIKYKRDIKEGYKSEFSLIAFVKRLAEFSNNQPELARKVLEQSFERNWKTVYKLQDDSFKSKPVTSNEINYKCDFIQEDGTYYNPYL